MEVTDFMFAFVTGLCLITLLRVIFLEKKVEKVFDQITEYRAESTTQHAQNKRKNDGSDIPS
jgi:hypothetical protein